MGTGGVGPQCLLTPARVVAWQQPQKGSCRFYRQPHCDFTPPHCCSDCCRAHAIAAERPCLQAAQGFGLNTPLPTSTHAMPNSPLPPVQLECPYHGWRFNGSGGCTAMPSTIHCRGVRVAALPCVERDGFVWVWPGEGEPGEVRGPEFNCREKSCQFCDCLAEHKGCLFFRRRFLPGLGPGWGKHCGEFRLSRRNALPPGQTSWVARCASGGSGHCTR